MGDFGRELASSAFERKILAVDDVQRIAEALNGMPLGNGVRLKPDGVPMWLWLRRVAEVVFMRDWPRDWNSWKSIREE